MPSARMPPRKAGAAPLHRLQHGFCHHQHYAFDGHRAVDAVGGWITRTMYQRSCSAHLIGSRFAGSFCCFNKNENLYGGKEMLYTKV